MTSSVFRAIESATLCEHAVRDTLQKWMDTYLHEVELQAGWNGAVARPRSWTRRNIFTKFDEEQLPLITVISPGLADVPVMVGDGQMLAQWSIGIGIVVAGPNSDAAGDLVRLYAATVRAILLQQQSLGGYSAGLRWLAERFDEIPQPDDRHLAGARLSFNVQRNCITTARSGPSEPDDPHDLVTITSWHVDVNRKD